jgi:hypothetical protein
LSGRVPAFQTQSPKFKPIRKNKKGMINLDNFFVFAVLMFELKAYTEPFHQPFL